MVQSHNIPLYQFQVRRAENDGQGNEFDPASNVQAIIISVQAEAKDGQGNEFHLTYQMGQPNNIPVEEEANGGQGNEFHPAGQMVQPNNIPDWSSILSLVIQDEKQREIHAIPA
ncbi:hypothetical protein R3W88_006483 [Solanum pinnatisectum]|uniref:Uncharacterized protein n=1 Tax=Solanum pinnatisectum TaxID=50273 RepID=A0AAV9KEV8_9SOLN|nr:hypothetical protein R3W88_006483 [Solanum pinnatisectum]